MKYNKVLIMLGISLLVSGCNSTKKEIIYLDSVKPIALANSENENKQYSVNDKWYYSQLTSEKQKKIYNQIYQALVEKEESIIVNSSDAELIKIVFKSVLYDNPEVFYIDSFQYIQHENNTITVLPIYNMAKDEIEKAEIILEAYKEDVLKHINSAMSDFEKEKVIYDYIATNTEYVIESNHNQNLYSVVLGQSVCLGYTRMFQYLCHQVNIPCTIVTGTNIEGVGHAWNAVCIDDKWYMVDCTNSMGQLDDSKEQISYYYFNITRELLLRSYGIDNIVKVPECNSIEKDYFNINGLYFDTVDINRYKELINQMQTEGKDSLTIRCSNSEVYEQILRKLVDEKELINMFESNMSISRVSDARLLIIKVYWM